MRRSTLGLAVLAALVLVAVAIGVLGWLGSARSGGAPPPDGLGSAVPVPSVDIPKFPWPPPRASSQAVLDIGEPQGVLGQLDEALSAALTNSGYVERSYFGVPGGFALVTRLEQTEADGRPKSGDERWSVTVGPLREFSLSAYLKALFTANPGYYRVLVFTLTTVPFSQSGTVTREQAMEWLSSGLNVLPPELAQQPVTAAHRATVLVYEFEQKQAAADATSLSLPGRLTARTHLEKTALWRELGQQ